MVIIESLVHFTVDEIFAAVEHLVLPVLPGVDVQSVLTVLRHLKMSSSLNFSSFLCFSLLALLGASINGGS